MTVTFKIEWAMWGLMIGIDFSTWEAGLCIGPLHIIVARS